MIKDSDYGKRLKSSESVKMRFRHPESEDVKTLAAGEPSPIIRGYTMANGGYFAVSEKKNAKEKYYIKDSAGLQVVPVNAGDESGYFSKVGNWASDVINNSVSDIDRNAGYVSDGFNESITDVGAGLWEFGGDLKKVAIGGAALLVLILIVMITNRV